jgi:hypothetical protein
VSRAIGLGDSGTIPHYAHLTNSTSIPMR